MPDLAGGDVIQAPSASARIRSSTSSPSPASTISFGMRPLRSYLLSTPWCSSGADSLRSRSHIVRCWPS